MLSDWRKAKNRDSRAGKGGKGEEGRTRGEGVVTVDDGAGEATVTGLGGDDGGEGDEGGDGGTHGEKSREGGVERVTVVRRESDREK